MINIVLGAIAPLALLVVAGYLIKTYRDDNVIKWVKIAVKAAEQIYNASGQGKEKFAYVSKWISEKFKIPEADLKNLIESAVFEIKKEE
jgi:DNA polymerase III sliding clamp (beta) subunit (PCNA family)